VLRQSSNKRDLDQHDIVQEAHDAPEGIEKISDPGVAARRSGTVYWSCDGGAMVQSKACSPPAFSFLDAALMLIVKSPPASSMAHWEHE
jgi:hypothetical protein